MKKLNICGLVLNFFGSLALIQGVVLNNTEIDQISGTYFDHNPYFVQNLIMNRNWALLGLILISVGFAFQLIVVFKQK
jgi:hypothetical protein